MAYLTQDSKTFPAAETLFSAYDVWELGPITKLTNQTSSPKIFESQSHNFYSSSFLQKSQYTIRTKNGTIACKLTYIQRKKDPAISELGPNCSKQTVPLSTS